MFEWIKKKISRKINSEMDGCIIQNYNFIHMVQAKRFALHEDIDDEIFDSLSKNVTGISMPFIDQKKPGPISNDIVNNFLNNFC